MRTRVHTSMKSDYRSHAVRSVRGTSATMWCGMTRAVTNLEPSDIKPCEDCMARIKGGTDAD